MRKTLNNLLILPLKLLIHIYRLFISPLLGANCRFVPSCSSYALDALDKHGPLQGGLLTFKRIVRCHPWGGSGYDPVPDDPKKGKNKTE